MPAPQQTARMQELAVEICRYALETGELPTMAEMARRMGLSRTRVAQLWWRIDRFERLNRLNPTVHIKRAQAGYLLSVLKDIEKAAKMAGRVYPWRRRWQGPPKPPIPRPNPPRPWAASLSEAERHAEIDRLAERERQRRWERPTRLRFGDLIECQACHGTAWAGNDWCQVCKGDGMVVYGRSAAD
jgi:hypothetical protein